MDASPQIPSPADVGISGSARVYDNAGSVAALERLLADQHAGIVAWLQSKMPDRLEAEDLAQEIFISVGEALASKRVEQPVAYLRRAAKNGLANWYRDRKEVVFFDDLPIDVPDPRDPHGEEFAPHAADSRSMSAGDAMCAALRKDALVGGIRQLPDGQRAAFILTDIRGLTEREAAELLSVSRSTVSTQRARAHVALRDELRLADSC